MKAYFLTGLPRSRTAWLANFLTFGDSFCFHEALIGCGSMDDLKSVLASAPRLTSQVGDADPNLGFIPQSILETFPASRIVFIHRKMEDCVASEWHATVQDGHPDFIDLTQDSIHEQFKTLSLGLSYLWKKLHPERKLLVTYEELDQETTIREIWDFCLPNHPFPQRRYEMLRDLRVTQMMGQVLRRHPSQPFLKLIKNATVLENRSGE